MSPNKKKIKVNAAHQHAENEHNDHKDNDVQDDPISTDDTFTATPDGSENVVSDNTLLDDTAEAVADIESDEEDENPLVAQLEQAETRAAEYLDSLQRERATFQNYKKRVERERAEQAQTIAGNLLAKLLPVIDDFHRAMDAVPERERDEWFEGVSLIQRKLDQVLVNEGVTEIEALGVPFDPNFHEAIGMDPDSDAESGTVSQVLQRGYMHKDRVLRPALVRVAE